MASFLQNLFKKKSTSVIGIDIGSSAIKVVQLTKHKGKAILETYGSLALGPYVNLSIGQVVNMPATQIASVINDLVREANVTTRMCGISIPLRSSLVTLMELPALDNKKLELMIPLEARRYIPVPISEVTMDWWVIPKNEDERELDFVDSDNAKEHIPKTEVLVVSIHNEILNTYNQIVKEAGLESSFFEIEMFSTIRSLIDQEPSPIMVFDMGASSTKLYIVERGVVRQSHVINKGSQDVTLSIASGLQIPVDRAEKIKRNLGKNPEADEKTVYEIISLTLDYVFSEASGTILNYEKRANKTISKMYLTGGGVAMKGMYEYARARFQTEVVLGDPFGKIEAPAAFQSILHATGLDFAVAVGIALRKLQEVD